MDCLTAGWEKRVWTDYALPKPANETKMMSKVSVRRCLSVCDWSSGDTLLSGGGKSQHGRNRSCAVETRPLLRLKFCRASPRCTHHVGGFFFTPVHATRPN